MVEAAVAALAAECHAAGSLEAEWARAARVGAVLIGTEAAIGTAPTVIGAAATTGMARIGVATTGTATGKIRTADGVGGTATGGVIPAITSCSLAILAFRGGGAGAGALGQAAGAGDTRTVITATVILTTVAAMATRTTVTATDTAPSTSLTTEIAADPESPSCNGGCHGLVITVDPSTESWGRKHGAQSGRTSKNTVT